MGGLVAVPATGGSIPPPSANAAEANDKSNSTTANVRFMEILLERCVGEDVPQANSLVLTAPYEPSGSPISQVPKPLPD
jgi:hypothetical protein